MRQFFADWEHEEPAELHVECLDPGAAPGRLDADAVAAALDAAAAGVALMGPYWHGFARKGAGDRVNEWAPRRRRCVPRGALRR